MRRYEIRYNEKLLKHYFYDNELKEQISFDTVLKVLEEQNKQLAEKDKEIEEYKQMWKTADHENHILCNKIISLEDDHDRAIDEFQQERENLCKQIQRQSNARKRFFEAYKDQRHQICEKIREKYNLNNKVYEDELGNKEYGYYSINAKHLAKFLDQIEKGE